MSETVFLVPIEEVFSSKGRTRVLKELALAGELNVSELCRRAGLNHSTTKAHLHVLISAGLVEEKCFGRIRIYRYRLEDVRARAIKSLLELWIV